MIQELAAVHSVREVADGIFQLSFISRSVGSSALPGQFVNIRVEDSIYPLLRRPFSIFYVEGEIVSIIFNVIGAGTRLLSHKKPGDKLDVLGPLGNGSFPIRFDDYDTSVIVAGGLGIAPFPFFVSLMPGSHRVVSFIGARSAGQLVRFGLRDILVATDDGSEGFRGNIVDCLKSFLDSHSLGRLRIFSCGPMKMVGVLAAYAREKEVPCYASLECDMACGIGLCQGCPVETAGGDRKYALVCKDGPVFNIRSVEI